MYRFNGYDKRLDRVLETAVLIMEALNNMEHKFSYSMVGHSGDGPSIPLVDFGEPPQTAKDRLAVVETMHAHSQVHIPNTARRLSSPSCSRSSI